MGTCYNLLKIGILGELKTEIGKYAYLSHSSLNNVAIDSADFFLITEDYFLKNKQQIISSLPLEKFFIYCKGIPKKHLPAANYITSERELENILFILSKLSILKNDNQILENKFNLLSHIVSTTTELHNSKKLMMEFMDRLQLFLKTEAWSLLFINRKSKSLYFKLTNEGADEKLKNLELSLDKGIAGWALRTQDIVVVNNTAEDKRFFGSIDGITGFKSKNILAAPLSGHGELFGVLELINKSDGTDFNHKDIETFKMMVKHGSLIIHNAILFEEMKEMTRKDHLTGLFNASYLETYLSEIIAEATEKQTDISLIFLDLDNFKKVNDTYGHLAGSSVLINIANILKKSVTSDDFIVRYGGDEFVIVMKDCGIEKGVEIAKLIHSNISSYSYREIPLSVSIGIAAFPEHGSVSEEIIGKADKAMYARKMNGKNGIEIAAKKQ